MLQPRYDTRICPWRLSHAESVVAEPYLNALSVLPTGFLSSTKWNSPSRRLRHRRIPPQNGSPPPPSTPQTDVIPKGGELAVHLRRTASSGHGCSLNTSEKSPRLYSFVASPTDLYRYVKFNADNATM